MDYRVRALKESCYIDGKRRETGYELSYDDVEDDNLADIFSVYQVNEDGTDDWLADFYHRADAELFGKTKYEANKKTAEKVNA